MQKTHGCLGEEHTGRGSSKSKVPDNSARSARGKRGGRKRMNKGESDRPYYIWLVLATGRTSDSVLRWEAMGRL